MIDEYSDKLSQEMGMTQQLQMALDAMQSSQSIGVFSNKNCQKMQTLVKHLTIQVA